MSNKKVRPWVDEDRLHLDPLPPVSEHDTRPAVKDLIVEHSDKIQKVRANLETEPLYNPDLHDDLWILRFILSHKKTKPATEAAKATMEYRKMKEYDGKDIRSDWPGPSCSQECVRRYNEFVEDDSLRFAIPNPARGVALLVRLAGFDQHKMVKELSMDDWPFSYCSEWTFQVLDNITRRTGRLTKSFRIVDLDGFTMGQVNRENVRRDSVNSKEFEDFYPQMLGAVFVLNPASWFQVIFRLFRPLMPKRFIEKFNIITPAKNRKEFELLLQHISADHIPKRWGGNFEEWPYPHRIG